MTLALSGVKDALFLLDLIGEHAHDITASQQSQCSIAQLVEVYFKRNHASSGTVQVVQADSLQVVSQLHFVVPTAVYQ